MKRGLLLLVGALACGCAGAPEPAVGEEPEPASPSEASPSEGLTEAQLLEAACCRALFSGDAPSAEALQACARLEALGPEPRPLDEALQRSEEDEALPDGVVRAEFVMNRAAIRCGAGASPSASA